MSICAFTSVCEEDARWVPQYLAEAARLELPFVMHFDRCSSFLKRTVRASKWCIAASQQDVKSLEFDETHKQAPFDGVVRCGYRWAMAWDIDETYEPDARKHLDAICTLDADYVQVTWINLWGDPQHIRVDGPFHYARRFKFYNVHTKKWEFNQKVVNGAKTNGPLREFKSDLVCLHWGMMTRELRELHKARWDRIYNTATKGDGNPYGFWNYALDEVAYPPEVVDNPWKQPSSMTSAAD